MPDLALVAALPIGEFDTEPIRAEFDAIIQVFKDLGAELLVAEPVSDEAAAREAAEASPDRNPDLLRLPYDAIRARMLHSDTPPEEPRQAHQALTTAYTIAPADENALTAGLHLHLALKRLAQEYRLDAFAAECWTGLPRELGLNPC